MGSTGIAVSELDMEIGEYLPAREVMTSCCCYGGSRKTTTTTTHQNNKVVNGTGNGNTDQSGFINVSALNGNGNGNFNWISQSNSNGPSFPL